MAILNKEFTVEICLDIIKYSENVIQQLLTIFNL